MREMRRKLPENGERQALSMNQTPKLVFLLAAAVIALTACGEVAQLPIAAGVGSHPQLPPPNPTLIPTINIAPAKGWPANSKINFNSLESFADWKRPNEEGVIYYLQNDRIRGVLLWNVWNQIESRSPIDCLAWPVHTQKTQRAVVD